MNNGEILARRTKGDERLVRISIGLDIDGTITSNPGCYAGLAQEVTRRGGQVHVVSSRSEAARDETVAKLRDYGLRFDCLYLIPSMAASELSCPHPELNWYDKFLWGKVGYALEHELTHFVDDDARVATLFRKYAGDVVFVEAGRIDTFRL